MTPHASADLVAELIVHLKPGAVVAPGARGLLGGLPMGPIVRQPAPGTAAPQSGLDAMAHLPYRLLAGSTASLVWRQQGCQHLPLLISQVRGGGQAPGGHGRVSCSAG